MFRWCVKGNRKARLAAVFDRKEVALLASNALGHGTARQDRCRPPFFAPARQDKGVRQALSDPPRGLAAGSIYRVRGREKTATRSSPRSRWPRARRGCGPTCASPACAELVEVVILTLAGSATALATGLGAIPVSRLGARGDELRPALWGLTVGLMTVASIVGLLLPALNEGSTGSVIAGLAVGVLFLLGSQRLLRGRDIHVGSLSGAGVRRSVLVFGVLLVHSLPEGFAIGTAYASDTAGLGLFVILAIALQNIPEGTSVAIPMEAAGFGRAQQFWAAVATSVPQPVGALLAYALVQEIEGLLPFSFAFAAGKLMLALVVVELVPQAYRRGSLPTAVGGTVAGAGLMLVLAALLGV